MLFRSDRDLRRLADVVPALAGIEARHAWSGVEGYLPDMLPVIGESRTTPGVFHAFGFSGHGYQLSLGVGRVIADLVLTGRSDIPIAAFDIGRFTSSAATDERVAREFEPALVACMQAKPGVDHA